MALAFPNIDRDPLGAGISLRQLDDLCLLHFSGPSVDARQTRQLGMKLRDYIEAAGCRKLLISFEKINDLYGFLLSDFEEPRSATDSFVDSDNWVG